MTRYWCHSCNETVSIDTVSPDGDVVCPKCGSEFVEEYEEGPQQQQQHSTQPPPPPPPPSQSEARPTTDPFAQNIFSLFNTISARQQRNRAAHGQQQQQQQPGFRVSFVNYNSAGVPVSISTGVIGNGTPIMPGIPANMNGFHPLFNLFGAPERYHVDGREMTFDELLSHLFQASKAKGTPPASKEAVEKLRTIKVTQEHVDAEIGCAVCQEPLAIGEEVTELPCKHLYHHDCITPWLKMHNSCPECRYELPTDDADYETEKRKKQQQQEQQQQQQQKEEKESATTQTTTTATSNSSHNGNDDDDDDDDDDKDSGNAYDSFYI